MRKLMLVRGWLVGLTASAAMIAAPAAMHAQAIDFEPLGYDGECRWGGGAINIEDYQGFSFFELRPLDIDNYQTKCWGTSGQQHGYPLDAGSPKVVALGFGTAQVQRTDANNPFTLKSMEFGAGWSNATIRVRGFQGLRDGGETEMFSESLLLDVGSTKPLDFGVWKFTSINFFLIEVVDWGASEFKAWDTGAEKLDRTYFVSSMTVGSVPVPEPASIALLAAGLAGLGIAARRRRSVR